jgi:hypothetical protein
VFSLPRRRAAPAYSNPPHPSHLLVIHWIKEDGHFYRPIGILFELYIAVKTRVDMSVLFISKFDKFNDIYSNQHYNIGWVS